MSKVRTDGDIVRIARQMQSLLDKVRFLIEEIEMSEHPNKDLIIQYLNDNQIPIAAWPMHVVHHALQHPDQWETGDFGIRHK